MSPSEGKDLSRPRLSCRYRDGKIFKQNVHDVSEYWEEDSVAFLSESRSQHDGAEADYPVGCSFSFEQALTANGLIPRHQLLGRNVPMYKTNVPLCPSGGE